MFETPFVYVGKDGETAGWGLCKPCGYVNRNHVDACTSCGIGNVATIIKATEVLHLLGAT